MRNGTNTTGLRAAAALVLLAGAILSASAQVPGTPRFLVDDQFQQYTADELQFLADYTDKGQDPAKDSSWRGFLEWILSNNPPERPSPVAPLDGATVSLTPMLKVSDFADRDQNTQAGSQWQVAIDAAFLYIAWDSGTAGPALNRKQGPADALLPETTFYWRVRYKDNSGDPPTEWSKWSNEDGGALWLFTTGDTVDNGDTDGDGASDATETAMGSNPNDASSLPAKPPATGTVGVRGAGTGRDVTERVLLVNGQPYQIRGVGYQPTAIGQAPGYPGYAPYRQEQYERDLPLLRAMNCNTVRTWGKIDNDDGFLDACWNNGLDPVRVVAGFWIDPASDFSDATARAAIIADFQAYVATYKDHPAILMWLPGGEINYHLRSDTQKLHDWFTLLNGLGWAAYEVEGNTYHPVTTDFAADVWNGTTYEQDLLTAQLGVAELFTDDAHLTGLDLWGFNCYRGTSFDVPGGREEDGEERGLCPQIPARGTSPSGLPIGLADASPQTDQAPPGETRPQDACLPLAEGSRDGEGTGRASDSGRTGSLFATFAARSAKPMWLAEFGVDAWNHGNGVEDQDAQADGEAAQWAEIAANTDVCVGGSVMAYSDEWWKNRQTGTAETHDPGPWERGDQPDGWTDEEYYGIVGVSTERSADVVAPRRAYYTLGHAWGANWPPACTWGDSPVADEWYVGDVRLDTLAADPAGDDTIATVEFEYSLDSTDGVDGTWQDCGPADTAPPYSLTWSSQPTDGTDQDVWLRARAIDDGWSYSAWAVRRIRIDNSYTGIVFDPHPGEADVPIDAQLTLTFATVVTKADGTPLTDDDLPALLSFRRGDADVPFTATITAEERAHTVITVAPTVLLDGVATYILAITGDLIDENQVPVPHASLTFTTTHGQAAALVFRQQPGGGPAGVAWSRQPRVAVCDAWGNTVTDSAAAVTVALVSRAGSLTGTTTVDASGGVASFSDLWIDAGGEHVLDASSPGLTGITSDSFTIMAGALDHFRVEGIASPVTAGAATSPKVTALDAFDNVKTDYGGTVFFSSSDPQASLPLPYTFYAAEQGTHIFGFRVSFHTPGEHWVQVRDGAAEGVQSGITVLNGPPEPPAPVSPPDGSWARVTAALEASAFVDLSGSGHAASQWQVAADAEFTTVVWDSGETAPTATAGVPAGALAPGTAYHWRVRYKDDSGDPTSAWSEWSDNSSAPRRFVTSYPVPFTDGFATDTGWVGLVPGGRAAPRAAAWERGPATAGGGAYGHPDPAADHSDGDDNHILGFALGDDYAETMAVADAISPALDCTEQAVVELSFWRWLGVDTDEWAHAGLHVSTDGTTWAPVWESGPAAVTDSAWTLVTYDLTPVAAHQSTVFLKFTMGPMYLAYPYCGWNIDDLEVRAGAADLVTLWLEPSVTEVVAGSDFDVRVYTQENSPLAQGFRGGPVDMAFDPAAVEYSGSFSSNSVVQAPFNTIKTSGTLLTGRIDDLGGVTTQNGVADGSPALYAVLTFRAAAAGTATFNLAAGSSGFALSPPVGQVGTWRATYGPAVSVAVTPYVAPPAAEVVLEGPTGAVCVGDTFDVKVYVRETSAQAHGVLGGPLDVNFDHERVQYHGVFSSATVIQPPFRDTEITNGTLRETRIDELGGVTFRTGFGDGPNVLYAILTFDATTVGAATFSVSPGESGLALTQPVGQLEIAQIDYGDVLVVEVSATPKAQLSGLPANPTNARTMDVAVGGYRITHYRCRVDSDTYGPETPVSARITAADLAEGLHTLTVLAKNADDQWQDAETPTVYSWIVDLTPPQNPTLTAADPSAGAPTTGTSVALQWIPGSDVLAGVSGYSWLLDKSPLTPPAPTITGSVPPAFLELGAAGDGGYWIHVGTCDRAGNWSMPYHCGPWTLDTTGPVAHAGGPYLFSRNTALNGTGSTDGTSGIASYEWSLTSDPLGAAAIEQASTSTPVFRATANGTYGVRLAVTDQVGFTATADADIVFNRTRPVLTGVLVNNGAAQTAQCAITVTISVLPGDALNLECRIAEAPGEGDWAALPALADGVAQTTYQLSPGDGDRPVFVTVRDADYPYPDYTSAEASATITLDMGSWTFPVTVTNANTAAVRFGMSGRASDSYDDGIDGLASFPSPGTGGVYFYTDDTPLWYDFRLATEIATWSLTVTAGRTGTSLSWTDGNVPAGREITISQLDGNGEPVPGTAVSMAAAQSVSIPAWTSKWFRIDCESVHAPWVQPDRALTVAEDCNGTPLAIPAPSDADGDALTITVKAVPDPSRGTVTTASGGAVAVDQVISTEELTGLVFDTTPDANGSAGAFRYETTDGTTTVGQTVTIDITPLNDPPINTAAPRVTGLHRPGGTLIASPGTWTDEQDTSPGNLSYAYWWEVAEDAAGTNVTTIEGAESASYSVAFEDEHRWLRVAVTCTDDGEGVPPDTAQSTVVRSAWTFVGGTLFRLWVDDAGGTVATLEFGEMDSATAAFDAQWDSVAGAPAVGRAHACLYNQRVADVGKQELSRDVRAGADTNRWCLKLIGPVTRQSVTLTWDVSAAEEGRELYLQEVIDEQAVGFPIDMRASAALELAGDAEFEIAYSAPMQNRLALLGGWNLVGNPIMSLQSTGEILDDGTRASVGVGRFWYWRNGGYQAGNLSEAFGPERGYWIYCLNDWQSGEAMGVQADGVILLKSGWNLISPVADCAMPFVHGMAGPAWYWDAPLAAYRVVGRGDLLEAGRGYWVHVISGEPVLIQFGQ